MPDTPTRPQPLVDRSRELLQAFDVAALAARLRELEAAVRFGRAGEPGPSILAQEVAEARERGAELRRRQGAEPPELLILTVGTSPEPLLLAIAYHAPRAVALLVSTSLPRDAVDDFRELWESFAPELGLGELDGARARTKKVRDRPAELFGAVRAILERRPGRSAGVVLDITGAKKAMIAGAFLAAGLFDVEVSYVDFEGYHPQLRRPDPGSSRPVELPHPERVLRLRDESRLHEAFDGGRYGEARALAHELAAVAGTDEVREVLGRREAERRRRRLERAGEAAAAYELWRQGFYRDARDKLAEAGLPVPETVAVLGAVWPRRDDDHKRIVAALAEDAVFAAPAAPLAYFIDVLAWSSPEALERRPRAGYLRIYGAIESALFYAFDAFAVRGGDPGALTFEPESPERLERFVERYATDKDGRPIDWPAELRRGAIAHFRQSSLAALRILDRTSAPFEPRPALQELLGERAPARAALPRLRARLARPPLGRAGYNRLAESKKGGLGRFVGLRNKAVHWLAPVPAEMALDLRRLFGEVLAELVPQAVRELRQGMADEEAAALERWEARVEAAVEGEVDPALRPRRWGELEQRPEEDLR